MSSLPKKFVNPYPLRLFVATIRGIGALIEPLLRAPLCLQKFRIFSSATGIGFQLRILRDEFGNFAGARPRR